MMEPSGPVGVISAFARERVFLPDTPKATPQWIHLVPATRTVFHNFVSGRLFKWILGRMFLDCLHVPTHLAQYRGWYRV